MPACRADVAWSFVALSVAITIFTVTCCGRVPVVVVAVAVDVATLGAGCVSGEVSCIVGS